MIGYGRPALPPGWPPAAIQRARLAVRGAVAAGQKPIFPDHWRDHKSAFERAQHSKCGFCESKVTMVHTGAVEHHAPKGEVRLLLVRGREKPDSSNVDAPKTAPVHTLGYWWRAYDWDNWLYACDRCNSAWKGCLYPVAEDPHPAPIETVVVTPLLLHPFEGEPLEHLDMDNQGFILARGGSAKGRATIDTCGLDRESLRKERERVATLAAKHAKRVLEAVAEVDHRRERENVKDLRDLGAPEQPWAGTVRAVVQRELGVVWDEFLLL